MTEHEAWLELARMWEPGKRLPTPWGSPLAGLCPTLAYLRTKEEITMEMRLQMHQRLVEWFRPPGKSNCQTWWGGNHRREARVLACGLLAAMTDG